MIVLLSGAALVRHGAPLAVAVVAARQLHHVYAGRDDLPDLDAFIRFELPTVGRIYDANGEPLIELADQYRDITHYDDIPPVVRQAILAAEDKRFFAHDGVDYFSIPRVVSKVRIGALAETTGLGSAAGPARAGDLSAGRIDHHPTARARRLSPGADRRREQPPASRRLAPCRGRWPR